ncbi:UvrD-helicase domain-containing protein [Sphingopyxis macrogoltabida]|uniref:UvrD-like helicase ATP-binding domain-containing protein n=1 Tax=Sphingopyxis macrogoltabida TaxID=33050 RepID=A0A0N9UUU1_SPHMC|nr:UvrD-helicase domain-containing protein [Sphingopyxis macrogoltabida]ALH79768.1 hypothetical protein AN936_05145 [Sphingopyxis macrogoltabida]
MRSNVRDMRISQEFQELRRIADFIRSFVHARRSASVAEVCEWASRFLDPLGASEDARIRPLISLLCEAGDFGFGSVREEQVLIALPERRVELPDGRVIRVGDHGMPMSEEGIGLFPDAALPPCCSLLEYLQEIDDAPPPHLERFVTPSGTWAEVAEIPKALSRALALCGSFDPATKSWFISDQNASFINDWLGLHEQWQSLADAAGPDPEQQRVIEAPANARLLVEAGPGSGKTFVACARIASLVDLGEVVPSRILVLSFTRVAVAELRDRVAALSPSSATSAIHTRTFDAFAARLLGAAGQPVKGGHDASIRAATRLLVRKDPLVLDIVSGFEHVVIDEAQDLVGDRKAFCDALVEALHDGCGVTVLGDPAQAIYGYQVTEAERDAFVETVCNRAEFSTIRLEQDHRTKTPALGDMFAECRDELLSPASDQRARYFKVRDRIQAAASESGISGFAGHASTTRGLILTRGRGALITAAEALRYRGREFRIRVPDRPLHIEAWIGATLGGLPGNERISRDGFSALFDELAPACDRDIAECWEILQELEGATGPHVIVSNIAEALEDPVLEIVRDHEGNTGPLLSTIHAIKGRESDRVMLLLTKAPTGEDVDWDEEARTLYVGATRASAELRTGWVTPNRYFRTGRPERYWAPRAGYRMLEIGLDGDLLSWSDLLKNGLVPKPRETVSAIWAAARAQSSLRAVRNNAGQYILSLLDENSTPLGCLSATFLEILHGITQADPESPGPDAVDAIAMSGATTVFSSGVTGNSPPIGLMPLLSGFCRVDR